MGAALILAREATYGVGLASDWAAYIATARNLLAGEWFVQIDGWPYLHWPPLYPLLLAAASFGVFDPYHVAGPLNAVIFGLTIFVAGQGLRRHVRRAWLVVGAVIAIMLALPLTWVASFAISEAPFILLVTLALFQADKYLERGRRSDLIWAAAFTSLAILTRYIGVTLILAIVPLLLLQRGAVPWDKARRSGLYLLIATAPVGLWQSAERSAARQNPRPNMAVAIQPGGGSGQVLQRPGRVGVPLPAVGGCQRRRRRICRRRPAGAGGRRWLYVRACAPEWRG